MDEIDTKVGSEHVEMTDHSTDSATDDFGFTRREHRKIVHKIDRRLITGLGLLFGISLVDRTNLGNASIAGCVTPMRIRPRFWGH